MLIMEEFVGKKMVPRLTKEVFDIYHDIASDKKVIDGVECEFSHGDFAPYNIRKLGRQYMVFDWEYCGYRLKGFDIMHYALMTKVIYCRQSVEDAFDLGIRDIWKVEPDFTIDRELFMEELYNLRIILKQ